MAESAVLDRLLSPVILPHSQNQVAPHAPAQRTPASIVALQMQCMQDRGSQEWRLLASLLALLENTKASIRSASGNQDAHQRVLPDSIQRILVRLNGPLRCVELWPVDLHR